MGKLKKILVSMCTILLIPLLAACQDGKNVVSVSWIEFAGNREAKTEVTLTVGATYNLEYQVMPAEATDPSVEIESSNESVATVTDAGVVTAVSVGTAKIVITSTQNPAATPAECTVTVVREKRTLPTPLNLNFDGTQLRWAGVEADQYNPVYELRIQRYINDTETEEISDTTVNTSYSAFVRGNKYKVAVRAKGNNILYNDSQWSADAEFIYYAAPSNIIVETVGNTGGSDLAGAADPRVSVLKFDLANYADTLSCYHINITYGRDDTILSTNAQNLLTQAIRDAQIDNTTIGIVIPDGLDAGLYNFTITTLSNRGELDDKGNIKIETFDPSAKFTFEKLGAPINLAISGNASDNAKILSWTAVTNAVGYKIVMEFSKADSVILTKTEYVAAPNVAHTLSSRVFEAAEAAGGYDKYEVFMYALGNGTTVVDSDITSGSARAQLDTVTNLASSRSGDDIKFTWDAVKNAGTYNVFINDKMIANTSTNTITLNANDKIDVPQTDGSVKKVSIWEGGTNLVKVSAVPADGSNYTSGQASNILEIIKLKSPQIRLEQGVIRWNTDIAATGYELIVVRTVGGSAPVTEKIQLANNVNTYELGHDYPAGTTTSYKISIIALGGSEQVNPNVLKSEESECENLLHRLETPTNLRVVDGEVRWDGSGTTQFRVKVKLDTGVEYIATVSEAYSILDYLNEMGITGTYYLSLMAIGDDSVNMNSAYSSEISTYKLPETMLRTDNGVLSWDAPSDSILAGVLDSLEYEIQIDSNLVRVKGTSTVIQGLNGGRTYNARIRVVVPLGESLLVGNNLYVLNSDYSSFEPFVQLSAPKNLTMAEGILNWGFVYDGVEKVDGYKVVLNEGTDKEKAVLCGQDQNYYVIDAKDLLPGEYTINVYALGSDEFAGRITSYASNITIYKLDSPEVRVQDGLLTWSQILLQVNGVSTPINNYILRFIPVQEGAEKYITLEDALSYDLNGITPGVYNVTVTATSNVANVFNSEPSNGIAGATDDVVVKLVTPSVTPDKITVTKDTITWEQPVEYVGETINYFVKITRYNSLNQPVILETRTVATNSYTFTGAMLGGKYVIQISAIGQDEKNQIRSNYSEGINVVRLSSVNGFTIDASANLSWNSIEGSNIQYQLYTNMESEAKAILNTTTVNLNDASLKFTTGLQALYVRTVISSDEFRTVNDSGVYTYYVDSAPSTTYNVRLFTAPSLSMSTGILTWANPNAFNSGVRLRFTRYDPASNTFENSSIIKNVSVSEVQSMDLSDSEFRVGDIYKVEIMALGNGGTNIDSLWGQYDYLVTKFDIMDNWSVQKGYLKWSQVDGATAYKVYATVGNYTSVSPEIVASASSYQYLPDCDAGKVGIQFQVIGGETDKSQSVGDSLYKLAFVSSELSTRKTLNKLAAPNDMHVINGEVDWGTRDASGAWINVPAGVTGYRLQIDSSDDEIKDFEIGLSEQQFIASEHGLSAGIHTLRLSAFGSDWDGITGAGDDVYLTSNYGLDYNVMTFEKITDLRVENGVLRWDDSSKGENYELYLYSSIDGNNTIINTQDTTHDLRDYVGTWSRIEVRNRGTGQSSTVGIPRLNSQMSNTLTNITKLPDMQSNGMGINEDGELIWTYGNGYQDASAYAEKLKVQVNITLTDMSGGVLTTVLNSVDYPQTNYFVPDIPHDTGIVPTYNISVRVMGSSLANSNSAQGYVSSNNVNMTSYKMGSLSDFTTDASGLKLQWNTVNATIPTGDGNLISPDKFIIEYKMLNDPTWYKKYVYGINMSEIPLWKLGTYETLRISALTQDQRVFKSEPVTLSNVVFDKFDAGEGTREDPFIISTNEQFGRIYVISDCYFRLNADLTFTDLDELKLIDDTLPYNIPLDPTVSTSTLLTLNGGFDGAGHTISGLQFRDAYATGLWNIINGGAYANAQANDPYLGRTGIVMNLNVQVRELTLRTVVGPMDAYNGVISSYNYGWIVNCSVVGAEVAGDTGLIPVINTAEFNTENEIYFGSIAGYVGCYTDENGINGDYTGRIYGCSNYLNLDIMATGLGLTTVGGIAGQNSGGTIINCVNGRENWNAVNGGNIRGTRSGGIVGDNQTAKQGDVLYVSVISGCVNKGTVTAAAKVNNYTSPAGGIAGSNNLGNITYCINRGTIKAENAGTTNNLTVRLGGIAGLNEFGAKLYNCYSAAGVEYNAETFTQVYVGGITGANENSEIGYGCYDSTLLANVAASGDGNNGTNINEYNLQTSTESLTLLNYTNLPNGFNARYENYDGTLPQFTKVEGEYPEVTYS